MEFFNSAIDVLQTLITAIGAGLAVWGRDQPARRLRYRYTNALLEKEKPPLRVAFFMASPARFERAAFRLGVKRVVSQ